ncbi:hypothetical protein HanLR1_Chr13g0506671 [Helianthus annuus]|nr:hypothetical protein HanLR1_Chr13g0506671 [Helianthus annuus]
MLRNTMGIKLSIAGKDTIKEDDHDIISSISGSEDKDSREFGGHGDLSRGLLGSTNQKVSIRLPNGESVSFWKCLLLGDDEKSRFEHDLSGPIKDDATPFLTVREVIEKMLNVINEPRNNTCLRVILLASAGRFAGCVFDGNTVVTHKTFHRFVLFLNVLFLGTI